MKCISLCWLRGPRSGRHSPARYPPAISISFRPCCICTIYLFPLLWMAGSCTNCFYPAVKSPPQQSGRKRQPSRRNMSAASIKSFLNVPYWTINTGMWILQRRPDPPLRISELIIDKRNTINREPRSDSSGGVLYRKSLSSASPIARTKSILIFFCASG